MQTALASMGYPHWLIAAGFVLLTLGLIGMVLRKNNADPVAEAADSNPVPSESEVATQTEVASRDAALAEQRKMLWGEPPVVKKSSKPHTDA